MTEVELRMTIVGRTLETNCLNAAGMQRVSALWTPALPTSSKSRCPRSRSRLRFSLVFAALFSAACTAAAPLPRVWVHAGSQRFHAEVAKTPSARARGLKGRQTLGPGDAMLFVFDKASKHCFWMKGTAVPLSVAFLADDGTIVATDDMQPNTDTLHCAPEPVRYALEAAQGAFVRKGMRVGTRLRGAPFADPQWDPRGQ
jgi:hypothetical protein